MCAVDSVTGFWLGVIEGFYGRSWSWRERGDYASFLAAAGYQCYLYAPKADAALRRAWREPLPETLLQSLTALGQTCRAAGIQWGVGLSPLGYGSESGDARRLLDRLRTLDQLGPDRLCVLFDDMALPPRDLASHQARAVLDALDAGVRARLALCPTYYCDDPLLDQLFGQRPEGYLEQLGAALPAAVEVFWTGRSVLNAEQRARDFRQVAEALRRKPLLWDNYPVNDGRRTSNFLHLLPFAGRPPDLSDALSGHVVNPMNQPWLSRLPLVSLARIYRGEEDAAGEGGLQHSLRQVDAPTRGLLQRDAERFAARGLSDTGPDERQALLAEYGLCDSPWATEVRAWLNGEYVFDPACLND